MQQYTIADILVGNDIITQDDLDTGAGWGKVIELHPDTASLSAMYDDGETYLIDEWAIVDRRLGSAKPDDDDANTEQVTLREPIIKPMPTPQPPAPRTPAAALSVNRVEKVHPGVIVTCVMAGTKGPLRRISRQRLWVVLNWTKNSKNSKVNIALVNGLQPGESFNGDYISVDVEACVPVNFKTYIKPEKGNA